MRWLDELLLVVIVALLVYERREKKRVHYVVPDPTRKAEWL